MNLQKRVEQLEQATEANKPNLYLTTEDGQTYHDRDREYTRAEVERLEETYTVHVFKIDHDGSNADSTRHEWQRI